MEVSGEIGALDILVFFSQQPTGQTLGGILMRDSSNYIRTFRGWNIKIT